MTTDTPTICIDGQWFTARWIVGAVDPDTGAVYLTGAVTDPEHTVIVRLDMATVRRLRTEAGFTGPVPAADSYDCRTIDQRLTELERSHCILDDRDIDATAELKQQLDALAAEYSRLSGAVARLTRTESDEQETQPWPGATWQKKVQ